MERTDMNAAVEVQSLTKKYGDLVAVDNVSFAIEKGEIFGLLGPNGAGKTTTVEIIEGLRKPDSGSVTVMGIDALKDSNSIKEIIGVQLQSTTIYDEIRVEEAISLFGSYYQKSIPTPQILDEVTLNDKRDSRVDTLSGGQKQRLALGLALVNDPQVLFLDEPTTGLDPQARRNVWDIIDRLKGRGKTVVLTTHYMEEAEQLAGRVGIIDHGKIIALDTPRNLIDRQNLESAVEVVSPDGDAEDKLRGLPGISRITRDGRTYLLHTTEALSLQREIMRLADQNHLRIDSVSVRRATLEDVFLALTGRKLRS